MKKFDWAKWSAIAEIISAIAIVISLVFVGLEIRDNTAATYAATYDQLLADQSQWRMQAASSPELLQQMQEDEMFGGDIQATKFAAEASLQSYERAYFARFYGRLGDREWERFEQNLCDQKLQIARFDIPRGIVSPDFWDFVQQQDC